MVHSQNVYLADHSPRRIIKLTKILLKNLFLKTNFPVKTRDIYKVVKKNSIGISVFGYDNKEKHPIYVSKKYYEGKHFDLILIGEGGKGNYVSIKDFDSFMYDNTLHRGRKHLFRYCLQAFSTEEN